MEKLQAIHSDRVGFKDIGKAGLRTALCFTYASLEGELVRVRLYCSLIKGGKRWKKQQLLAVRKRGGNSFNISQQSNTN